MNEGSYYLPADKVSSEIIIKNSRFLSYCTHAATVEHARDFISEIKKNHPGAAHHVPAFVIGHGPSTISHCSDNGEPSGTAGKPTLVVLQGSALGDVVLVTVRYFGGIKLGTGGLVKAYTESAQEVLKLVRRAIKIPTHNILIEIPYTFLEPIRRLIPVHQGIIDDEEYSEIVVLSCTFPVDTYEDFAVGLTELSSGTIEPVIVSTNADSIFPVID
ncbi:MAG: YigZ family protein [Anaerolineaceae bacterium]|nr:YigZ family protein [Anaerolineaceae bacterium]